MILSEIFCTEFFPNQKNVYKYRQNLFYAQQQSMPFTAQYSQVSQTLNSTT